MLIAFGAADEHQDADGQGEGLRLRLTRHAQLAPHIDRRALRKDIAALVGQQLPRQLQHARIGGVDGDRIAAILQAELRVYDRSTSPH